MLPTHEGIIPSWLLVMHPAMLEPPVLRTKVVVVPVVLVMIAQFWILASHAVQAKSLEVVLCDFARV